MKYKNKGSVKQIKAKLEDDNLIEVSKWFLKDLEEQFTKKTEGNKENEMELKAYINNENFIFTPEVITKKSPLTLINAPWGTGKTYFIENLLKLMIDKKLESEIFKKMIIIDAWKFSSSKDVPIEFIQELAAKLIPASTAKGVKTEVVKKFLSKIAPSSLTFSLNLGVVGLSATKDVALSDDEASKAKKILEGIVKNEVPTIIFIDNLERLGSLSWDLLKAIIKLQEFTNFLIILPLNLNKFRNNAMVDTAEYPIEKYVDFHYYDFQQDYDNYFKKHFQKNVKLIENLNNIFNHEIDGEKLTIREVQSSFESHMILTMNDDYEIFKTIKEHIWSPQSTFNGISKRYLNDFLETEKKKRDLYKEIRREISRNHEGVNIYRPTIPVKNGFDGFIADNGSIFYYNVNQDYGPTISNIKSDIDIRKAELGAKIADLKSKIFTQDEIVKNKTNHNEKLDGENKANEAEQIIEQQKEGDDFNSSTIAHLKDLISINTTKMASNSDAINEAVTEKNKLVKDQSFQEDILDMISMDIEEKATEYAKIVSENPLSKFAISNIYKILNDNVSELSKKFDEYEEFQDIAELEEITKMMI